MQKKAERFSEEITKGLRPYYLLMLVVILLYGWTLGFGFTYLDDNVLILDNLFFIKNLGNFVKAFQIEVFHVLHSSAAYYRPLLTLSFILDAQFSGESPFFYHLSNIVIHIINSALFYVLIYKIGYKKYLALSSALVFAVHPVLTQAVAWVPGRNDSLLFMVASASFIFFIDYFETNKIQHLLLHLLFWVLSLFTKESSALLVGLCGLYATLFYWKKINTEKVLTLGVSWFLIFSVWFFMRSSALVNPVHYTPVKIIESVVKNFPATLLFLGKVFFPFNLSVLPTLQDSTLIWGVLSVALISLLIVKTNNRNYKRMLFGMAWFVAFLLPSFVRPNTIYVADFIEHRMYVPIFGLFIVLLDLFPFYNFEIDRKSHLRFLGILLIVLMSLTLWHSRDYRNQIVFWENAVRNSSSHPLAHKNLGAMYYLDGRIDEAEIEYRKSLELNPVETMVHNNLGLIYSRRGDEESAEKEYLEELKINPYYDKAHFNYGALLYRRGDYEKAKEYWLKTLMINPDYVDVYKGLAKLYYDEGDMQRANYYLDEARKRGATI